MQPKNRQILVHACCGVCFSYPLIFLKDEGFLPVVYYFNDNIYPKAEFDRRYLELEKYCSDNHVQLIKEEYDHSSFLNAVEGLEGEPERGKRCKRCFYQRIKKTALKAQELGINDITTTLSISPHKISKDIFEMADLAVQDLNVNFVKYDFKKKDGFKKTSKIAYSLGMYRQNYCGCEFSKK